MLNTQYYNQNINLFQKEVVSPKDNGFFIFAFVMYILIWILQITTICFNDIFGNTFIVRALFDVIISLKNSPINKCINANKMIYHQPLRVCKSEINYTASNAVLLDLINKLQMQPENRFNHQGLVYYSIDDMNKSGIEPSFNSKSSPQIYDQLSSNSDAESVKRRANSHSDCNSSTTDIIEDLMTQEEYEVLMSKINARTYFRKMWWLICFPILLSIVVCIPVLSDWSSPTTIWRNEFLSGICIFLYSIVLLLYIIFISMIKFNRFCRLMENIFAFVIIVMLFSHFGSQSFNIFLICCLASFYIFRIISKSNMFHMIIADWNLKELIDLISCVIIAIIACVLLCSYEALKPYKIEYVYQPNIMPVILKNKQFYFNNGDLVYIDDNVFHVNTTFRNPRLMINNKDEILLISKKFKDGIVVGKFLNGIMNIKEGNNVIYNRDIIYDQDNNIKSISFLNVRLTDGDTQLFIGNVRCLIVT